MTGRYKISARPILDDGELVGVAFSADSPQDHREWQVRNCGQFPVVFARVMPANVAWLLITALKAGDEVELPGVFEEAQFERGFAFEWTPVHFVAPPQFAKVC